MFHGWIDPLEPFHLIQRLRRDPVLRGRVAGKLRILPWERVVSSWAHTSAPPANWWNIPKILENGRTGDPGTPYHVHVVQKYLESTGSLHALSLGCGNGAKEISWAETERFRAIDAYDISERRIQAAIESVRHTRLHNVVHFRRGDAHELSFPFGHDTQ